MAGIEPACEKLFWNISTGISYLFLFQSLEYKTSKKEFKDEWTQRTENSEIFFLDFDKKNDDSDESKLYFNKKNPINVFSNST